MAFLGGIGLLPVKFLVYPWLGVILPSAYLPVRGSGVVWTGLNSLVLLLLTALMLDLMVDVIMCWLLNSCWEGSGVRGGKEDGAGL